MSFSPFSACAPSAVCPPEVGLRVPLLVTTPLISRVNSRALFAPSPRPCDQKP